MGEFEAAMEEIKDFYMSEEGEATFKSFAQKWINKFEGDGDAESQENKLEYNKLTLDTQKHIMSFWLSSKESFMKLLLSMASVTPSSQKILRRWALLNPLVSR